MVLYSKQTTRNLTQTISPQTPYSKVCSLVLGFALGFVFLCTGPKAVYYATFFRFKNGPFSERQKNIILCDSKRSIFITDFFELQFHTANLIIQAVYYARFFKFKNGPFSQKAKNNNLMRLKTEQFHHRFFSTPV